MGTKVGKPINVSHEHINSHLWSLLRLVYDLQNRTIICQLQVQTQPPLLNIILCTYIKEEEKTPHKYRRKNPTSPVGPPGNGELNHKAHKINFTMCKAAQILQLHHVSTIPFHFWKDFCSEAALQNFQLPNSTASSKPPSYLLFIEV